MKRLVLLLLPCLLSAQVALDRQGKSSCSQGWVFFAGNIGQVDCSGNIKWSSNVLTISGGLTLTGGNFDVSSAGSTKPVKSGTSLPSTCSPGELFFKTDATPGENLYACTSTNTWTQVSGAGGVTSFIGLTDTPSSYTSYGNKPVVVKATEDGLEFGSFPVTSVFGRTGAVSAQAGDYTASQITNTPAGNIAATNVQDAINELDNEKASTSHDHTLGGDVTGATGSTTVVALQGRSVSNTAPADGQALVWNDSANQWEPQTVSSGSGAPTDAAYVTLSSNPTLTAERVLTAGTGISITDGGADSTVTVAQTENSVVQKVEVAKDGTLTATRKRINFIEGSNVAITVADDSTNDKVDVTIAASPGESVPTRNLAGLVDDFLLDSSSMWDEQYSSSANSSYETGDSNHPGIRVLSTGASTGNYVHMNAINTINATLLRSGTWTFEAIVSIDSTLSVQVGVGFNNVDSGGVGSSRIAIEYLTGESDTEWTLATCSASTCTRVPLGVSVAAGTYYYLKLRGDGGTIYASVNGGTEQSSSTNLPTSALYMGAWVKTLASGERNLRVDFIRFTASVSR